MPMDPTPDMPPAAAPTAWARLRARAQAGWRGATLVSAAAACGALSVHLTELPGRSLALGALAALLGLALLAAHRFWPAGATTPGAEPPTAERAEELSVQVVPVWKRNLESAREHSARSAEGLLESFGRISSHVDQTLTGQGADLELGAIEALLTHHQPQLDALLATTRQAVALKDKMLAEVVAMSDSLAEMVLATREVQTIARATHLLSMNASIEATRNGQGQGQGGAGVVAEEVRRLASQSREAGTRIAKHVNALQARMQALKLTVRAHDTEDDELLRSAEEAARTVIASLLHSLAHVNRSSRTLRNAGRQLQRDIETIFVEMQSQDRLSQMLSAVADDMGRFVHWTGGGVDDSGASPRQWLERLEATYTMEDQRSTHHGAVAVERQATVEFF